MKKRIFGILLAVSLMISAMPVMAAELPEPQETEQQDETQEETQEETLISEYWINPIYEGIFTEDDIRAAAEDDELVAADSVVLNSDAEAVAYVKSQLKARNTSFSFSMTSPLGYGLEELLNAAMDEKNAVGSDEGDYILSHFSGANMMYNGTYSYTVRYLSTASQEAEVTSAVEKVLAELGISGKSDYQKVKLIHDYIVNHVVYLLDGQDQRHSAYGAIIDGKAVCQGYASLFYRMCMEAGIPTRIITGRGNGGDHAWNIVKLGDYWYNMDVTWDDPITNTGAQILTYNYFLKSEADFGDHDREEPYNTESFYREYPMGPVSYDESMDPGPIATPTPGVTPAPAPTPGTDPTPTPGIDPAPGPSASPSSSPAPGSETGFVDVKPGSWMESSIKFVNQRGLMVGLNASEFAPNQNLDRSMFAAVLYRLAGSPEVTYKNIFKDVPAGQWYSNAIIWAYESDIVKGLGDGYYGPKENITREQMARMLMQFGKNQGYSVKESTDLDAFVDQASVSSWARENVCWAVGAGIITGTRVDNKAYLNPKGNATRAECAVMLTKFIEQYM